MAIAMPTSPTSAAAACFTRNGLITCPLARAIAADAE